MALIKCPSCGHDVSDHATMCPRCNFMISNYTTYTGGSINSSFDYGVIIELVGNVIAILACFLPCYLYTGYRTDYVLNYVQMDGMPSLVLLIAAFLFSVYAVYSKRFNNAKMVSAVFSFVILVICLFIAVKLSPSSIKSLECGTGIGYYFLIVGLIIGTVGSILEFANEKNKNK